MLAFVYNAGHVQLGVSIFTMHDQCLPPPPPAPPLPGVPGVFEGLASFGWPPGFACHKKAPTVLVDGGPGVQQGHDLGYCIPHVAAPPNALMAVHTLLSKHKIMFPVSSVLLEGKPVGTNVFGFLDLICANPVSLPTGGTVIIKCTVMTSATLADILHGLAYIAIEMAFDYVWGKLMKSWRGFDLGKNSWLGRRVFAYLGDSDIVMRALKTFLKDDSVIVRSVARRLFVGQVVDKIIKHTVKSWLASPVVVGGAEHGTPGVGRGGYSHGWKPFGQGW